MSSSWTHADRAPQELSRRRRWRLRWLAAMVVVGVAASVVGCNTLQRRLIYPARYYDRVEFEHRVQRFGPGATVLAPFDAIAIEPASQAVATAIWFHGNGNVNTDFATMAAVFRDRRVRLVLAEYPGYGARAGVPSERVLVDDASALYAAVVDRYPQQPVVVIGQSLGSGVAAQVAADASRPAPQRLVLLTPFFDLPDAASHAFWNLPLQSIVNDRYDSGSALSRYGGSVVVVVAADDRFVGAEGGRRLARVPRPTGATTLIELAGADHNTWLAAMSARTWDAVLEGLEPVAAHALSRRGSTACLRRTSNARSPDRSPLVRRQEPNVGCRPRALSQSSEGQCYLPPKLPQLCDASSGREQRLITNSQC